MSGSLTTGGVLAATNAAEMLAAGCLAAGTVLTAIGTWQRRTVLGLLAGGQRATATAGRLGPAPRATPAATRHHVVWRFETAEGVTVEHEGLASGLHHPAEGDVATHHLRPRRTPTSPGSRRWPSARCRGPCSW